MKHVFRVINVLATVVILVAFVVLLRTVFTPAGEIPTIMGYGFMRTLTGSMEPTIPVHSFIVVDTDNSQVYQVGDIITFHSSDDALEGSLNTHRIVSVEAASDGSPVYHTKGDANPVEDAAPVPAADVVGRVVFVSAGLGRGGVAAHQSAAVLPAYRGAADRAAGARDSPYGQNHARGGARRGRGRPARSRGADSRKTSPRAGRPGQRQGAERRWPYR